MSGRSEQPDVVHHTDTEGDGRISTDKNWRRFRTALVAASILRKGNLQPIQRHDTESLSQDSWEWMYDVDAGQTMIRLHSVERILIQPTYRGMFHRIFG